MQQALEALIMERQIEGEVANPAAWERRREPSMHPLVGSWSIDCLYGPGAQEDTFLVFKEDGTGWIESAHYATREVDTFRWEATRDGCVRVLGGRYFSDGEESASDFSFDELAYRIAEEVTPDGETRPVVTFAQPVWIGNRRWGLLTRDVAALAVPEPGRPGG
jgi:hypothetical protein